MSQLLRAVLFDLDGTLLHIDTRRMVEEYTRLLARWFADQLDPARFVASLHAATRAMVQNRDPDRTNQQVFAAAFYPALGTSERALAPRLAEFYAREFPKLRTLASPDPDARRAVTTVLDRGLDAVVATNPIFPRSAIMQRLEWTGVADLKFAHITTYETAHFCKPHPEYFLEIAAAIDRDPRECMMIGNDAEFDLVAKDVGMRTYLVTDHLIARGEAGAMADYVGTLTELVEFLSAVDPATL